jgi:type IX secretion system PorP/SprF family membrane protein
MKKTIGILWVALCLAATAAAQPRFNDERGNLHYRDYERLINPSVSDSSAEMRLSVGVDKQWLGIEGAPLAEILQFKMPVAQRGDIGAWLYNESAGALNNIQFGVAYAYKIKLHATHYLSFGLNLSLLLMNESTITGNDLSDRTFAEPVSSRTGFNAGFGACYFGERFFAGFSVPQLLTNDIKANKLNHELNLARARYYFTGGYHFDLNRKIRLTPTALLQLSSGASVGYEIMGAATYNRRFEIGAGWSADANLQFAAGAAITKQLAIRYQFSQAINTADYHAGTSHFVVLRYTWGGF